MKENNALKTYEGYFWAIKNNYNQIWDLLNLVYKDKSLSEEDKQELHNMAYYFLNTCTN